MSANPLGLSVFKGIENKAVVAILILTNLINKSYVQLDALKPCTHSFSGSVNLLVLSVFMSDRKSGCGSQLEFIDLNKSTLY